MSTEVLKLSMLSALLRVAREFLSRVGSETKKVLTEDAHTDHLLSRHRGTALKNSRKITAKNWRSGGHEPATE